MSLQGLMEQCETNALNLNINSDWYCHKETIILSIKWALFMQVLSNISFDKSVKIQD